MGPGSGVCGQFIRCHLLPPQGEVSSHYSTAPAWAPSHGRQSSTDFSNVSCFWKLQLFPSASVWVYSMGYCPETGCTLRLQFLPINLLQHDVFSLWGHRTLQWRLSSGSFKLWAVMSPSWSQLALAVLDVGKALAASLEATSVAPCHANTVHL